MKGLFAQTLARIVLPMVLLLGARPVGAAAEIRLRAGDHPGFGRLVLDLPEGSTATARQEGDRISVWFLGAGEVGPPDPAFLTARNLREAVVVPGGLAITVAHGARLKVSRPAGRLVLDLLDSPRPASGSDARGASFPRAEPSASTLRPEAAIPAPAEPRSTPDGEIPDPSAFKEAAASLAVGASAGRLEQPASVLRVVPRVVAVKVPAPATASLPSAAPPPAEALPPLGSGAVTPSPAIAARSAEPALVTTNPQPPAESARQTPLALAAILTPTSMSLPFSGTTGAAAFSRGDWSYVVFDERRPIEIAARADASDFVEASVQLFAGATMLRFKSPPELGLSLKHDGPDWKITLNRGPAHGFKPRLTEAGLTQAGLTLPARDTGRVVVVTDPDGGGNLLVGTLRQTGEAVPAMRRTPEFILWPTTLGVVAEPLFDSVEMHAVADGFVITAGVGGSLGLSDGFLPETPAGGSDDLTRQFDLPALPAETLLRRMQVAVQAAAAAPAQARTDKRLAVAQAMLALGMGAEAQGVVGAVTRDDPRATANPDVIAVGAAAALLAGRVADGDAITDARVPETDETAFWRGIRSALLARDEAGAARILAPRIGLLISYPAPLRNRLVALVGETLAAGGQAAAVNRLAKAVNGDSQLALAKAMLADPGPGLAGLDVLAKSADRRVRARAARLAAEQRLTLGIADFAATADALEHLIYAWRGDGAEIALRERVAELRSKAGTPRPALAMLRETAGLWPEQAARVRVRMADMLEAAATPEARPALPPLEFVSMVEDNADLLPQGAAGERLAELLSERLDALDLPERAAAALAKLVSAAHPGAPRATLGARQASLRLARDDPAGALSALRDSDGPALAIALQERRELIRAQAQVAQNDQASALATLAPLHGPDAVILRGTLLENAHDWREAARTLKTLTVGFPADGALDETQAKLLLRVAADAAQAGDEDELGRLHQEFQGRLPAPGPAQVFALLTEKPIVELTDLSRAKREGASARGLPEQLEALEANGHVTR